MIRYTKVTPGETTLIANGETIKVHKISATLITQNAGVVSIFERDGITKITDIWLRAARNLNAISLETAFLAKNGIVIQPESVVNCTIYYSQGGA